MNYLNCFFKKQNKSQILSSQGILVMRRKRLTGSKILAKLRGVDELLAKGVTEDNAIRDFRISNS